MPTGQIVVGIGCYSGHVEPTTWEWAWLSTQVSVGNDKYWLVFSGVCRGAGFTPLKHHDSTKDFYDYIVNQINNYNHWAQNNGWPSVSYTHSFKANDSEPIPEKKGSADQPTQPKKPQPPGQPTVPTGGKRERAEGMNLGMDAATFTFQNTDAIDGGSSSGYISVKYADPEKGQPPQGVTLAKYVKSLGWTPGQTPYSTPSPFPEPQRPGQRRPPTPNPPPRPTPPPAPGPPERVSKQFAGGYIFPPTPGLPQIQKVTPGQAPTAPKPTPETSEKNTKIPDKPGEAEKGKYVAIVRSEPGGMESGFYRVKMIESSGQKTEVIIQVDEHIPVSTLLNKFGSSFLLKGFDISHFPDGIIIFNRSEGEIESISIDQFITCQGGGLDHIKIGSYPEGFIDFRSEVFIEREFPEPISQKRVIPQLDSTEH